MYDCDLCNSAFTGRPRGCTLDDCPWATPPAASDLERWLFDAVRDKYITDALLRLVINKAIAAARAEGESAERERWMCCADIDVLMEGPRLKRWNAGRLTRLWYDIRNPTRKGE